MAARTPRKASTTQDRAAFRFTLNRAMANLGAQKLGPDEWLLETAGGPMRFLIFEDWAGARFEDIEKAQSKLPKSIRSEMNRMTGQWNTHFGPSANAAAANDLAAMLGGLVPPAPKPKPAKNPAARRNPARPSRNPASDGDTFSQIEDHVQEFLRKLDGKLAEHRRLSGNNELHLRTSPEDLDARKIKAEHDDSIRTLGKLRAEVDAALEDYEFDRLVELGAVPADLVARHWAGVSAGMRNPAAPGRKPCGCESGRSEGTPSERRYRDLEAKAQRAAAGDNQTQAKRYRSEAKRILQVAHSAGEPWTTPPRRNPAGEPAFNDFDWNVIARIMGGEREEHKADGEVKVRMGKGPLAGKTIMISDNGGELNLSSVDPEGSRVFPYGTPHRMRDQGIENRPMYAPLVDFSIAYTSNKTRVGNVTLAYRIQSAISGQQIDYDLDLDRDMPDSNAIPPKVRELEEKVRAENPDYSVGQARATAWSIFCKHVDPTSQHCKKLRHQYFAIKGGKGSEGFGKIRVVSISLTVQEPSEFAVPTKIDASAQRDVWKQASSVLTDWARKLIAPDRIEERNAFFEIQWADGRNYRGTYELEQDDRRGADLSHHISHALQVFSGKYKPSGMSDKEYSRIVHQYGDEALGFIAKYDLGPSADEIDDVVKDMPKIPCSQARGRPAKGPVPLMQLSLASAAANSNKRPAAPAKKACSARHAPRRAALEVQSPAFQSYLEKLREQHQGRVLEAEDLKKYIRVSWKISPTSSSRSILLFVDKDTGNVHQAKSWKTPKPSVTGNIFDGR